MGITAKMVLLKLNITIDDAIKWSNYSMAILS